ncbi:MAG TPA: hypothetical protein VFF55_03650 [Candidatus Deferrimicrobium sp.]|nr:hypothetical protein [Candidatus Deferrimicrobium sp.]
MSWLPVGPDALTMVRDGLRRVDLIGIEAARLVGLPTVSPG